jgi:hypothetical protein
VDGGCVSIFTSNGLGSKPGEPIALVLSAKDLTFSHSVLARCTWSKLTIYYNMGYVSHSRLSMVFVGPTLSHPPRYLSVTEGETLYTDGIVRSDIPHP